MKMVCWSQKGKRSQVLTAAKASLVGSVAKNCLTLPSGLWSHLSLFWSLSCFPNLHLLHRQDLAELCCMAAQETS